MLAEERLARIMKLLSQQRTATVQELCEALDASESTIRRDLNELDRMGKVNKVHGGATLPDSQFLADEPSPRKSASPRRLRPSSPQRTSSFWMQAAPRWPSSGS